MKTFKEMNLVELNSDEMTEINGGNWFWYAVGYIAGMAASDATAENSVASGFIHQGANK